MESEVDLHIVMVCYLFEGMWGVQRGFSAFGWPGPGPSADGVKAMALPEHPAVVFLDTVEAPMAILLFPGL